MRRREAGMLFAWVLLVPALAVGGLVHTREARVEGAVAFRGGRVEVGGKAVSWDALLLAVRETPVRGLSGRDVVRLRSGEAWVVDVLGLAAGQLRVRSAQLGERRVAVGQVATVDFVRGLPLAARQRDGTLYRDQGEPVPGKVLWLDRRHIAIGSPLGVLEVPRRDATRYVFANGAAPAPPSDGEEVGLVDGSILIGRLAPAKDGFELDHALLGKLAIPGTALRSIVRRGDAVAFLAEQTPKTTAAPLVAHPAPPEPVACPAADGSTWLKGVRVAPRASLRYRLPAAAGRRLAFRAGLQPLPGARGDLRLRVLAGGKTLCDQHLPASAPWPALALDLPAARELVVEVDFGTRIRFPCGVVLCDPLVVVR